MLIYDPRISNVAFMHSCTWGNNNLYINGFSYEKFVRRLSKQNKRCCQFNLLRGTVITPVQHLVTSCSPKRIKLRHGDTASMAHRWKVQGQPGNDAHDWCELVLCRHYTTLLQPYLDLPILPVSVYILNSERGQQNTRRHLDACAVTFPP